MGSTIYVLLFYSEDGKDSKRIATFVVMMWNLWNTRNERIFREAGVHARMVLNQVNIEIH